MNLTTLPIVFCEYLLLHVVLSGVDVLQPQELLRAVKGVCGEGRLGHVGCAVPGEEPWRGETEFRGLFSFAKKIN